MTGIWHYHDVDRGGESYLDATLFRVIEPARPLTEQVFWPWWILGIGLLLVAYYLYWHKNQLPAPTPG